MNESLDKIIFSALEVIFKGPGLTPPWQLSGGHIKYSNYEKLQILV